MKAIVIGATGAVGKELVKVLLSRPDYETVITFTRRPLGIDSPKLESHVIDFDRPDTWEDLVRGGRPLLRPGYLAEAGGIQGGPV